MSLRRLLVWLALTRPSLAVARWLSRRLDAILQADFRARFVERRGSGTNERLEGLADLVAAGFAVASAEEKRSFLAGIEDRARSDEHTLAYAGSIFGWARERIERHTGSLAGLRVLELGPGHTLGPGLLLYASGVGRYVAVDFAPIACRDADAYRRLRARLAERPLVSAGGFEAARTEALRRFDEAVDLRGAEAVFTAGKVECLAPVDAAKLPFDDASFDVVISNAAFEHFLDPVAAVRETARVLVPGGTGLHQIDLRDHRDLARPLAFLAYEDDDWRRLHADMVCYTNRLRRSDFEEAFKAAGFEVEVEVNTRTTVAPAERATFHPRFRDRPLEDLEAVGVFVVAKKRSETVHQECR